MQTIEIKNIYGQTFTVSIEDRVFWKHNDGQILEIHPYWLKVKTNDGQILEIISECCWVHQTNQTNHRTITMTYEITTTSHVGSWTIQDIIDILQQYGDIHVLQATSDDVADAILTIETEIEPADLHGEVFYSHHLISNSNEFTVHVGANQ